MRTCVYYEYASPTAMKDSRGIIFLKYSKPIIQLQINLYHQHIFSKHRRSDVQVHVCQYYASIDEWQLRKRVQDRIYEYVDQECAQNKQYHNMRESENKIRQQQYPILKQQMYLIKAGYINKMYHEHEYHNRTLLQLPAEKFIS